VADVALRAIEPVLDEMYSALGRPSIPPERFAQGRDADGAVYGAQ